MGWRLNPSWSCRFHPWETTFSHSSVWSIHSFAADFTRLEDPQSPHQPKAVKELGRPYHSTHPWSPGESGGCGWTFLCGVDEILMTPPHITDSDLVHMMDLVWTSHTDKQQPHRQHLSWKRNAVACFGCCFTADLTSTYMFRAIFDCYGNTFCFWFNGHLDDDAPKQTNRVFEKQLQWQLLDTEAWVPAWLLSGILSRAFTCLGVDCTGVARVGPGTKLDQMVVNNPTISELNLQIWVWFI